MVPDESHVQAAKGEVAGKHVPGVTMARWLVLLAAPIYQEQIHQTLSVTVTVLIEL